MKTQCLPVMEVEARLRAADLRPTAQRLAIARYVLCETKHPTAEQVKTWADANFHRMSLATVYNTLASLVKAGLLKEVKLPHDDRTVYDDNTADHYHFLDEKTGRIWDVDPAHVDVRARLGSGMKVRRIDVLLSGTR